MNTNKDIQALSDEQIQFHATTWFNDPNRDVCSDRQEAFVKGMQTARAILAALQPAPVASAPAVAVPEGWQLVPKEPTQQMVNAGVDEDSDTLRGVYRAMLAAAPQPAAAPVAADVARGDAYEYIERPVLREQPFHPFDTRVSTEQVFDVVYAGKAESVTHPPADAAPVDAKPVVCPRCNGNHAGAGADGVENDCSHCVDGMVPASQPSPAPADAKELDDTAILMIASQFGIEESAAVPEAALIAFARDVQAQTHSAAPADAVPAQTGMQGETTLASLKCGTTRAERDAARSAQGEALSQEAGGIKTWQERFPETYPNFPIEKVSPSDQITWMSTEIAELRAALAQGMQDSGRDALIAQLRSELALAESSITSMADSMDSMTHKLNLNAKD